MAWLATRRAAALASTPSPALSAGQAVRGGGFRGDRGVLVAQRQLPFEIRDLFLRVGDFLRRVRQLSLALGQFAAQPLVLALQPFFGVRIAPLVPRRHALHGTPIWFNLYRPVNCYLSPLLKNVDEYERFRGMGIPQFEAEIRRLGR